MFIHLVYPTWSGPPWAPSLTLWYLLMSIRSLLNEAPFHNEPGFNDKTKHKVESALYNEYVQHETFRIAVISHVQQLIQKKKMKSGGIDETSLEIFLGKIDYYKQKAEALKNYKKGQKFQTCEGRKQVYSFESFAKTLPKLEITVKSC